MESGKKRVLLGLSGGLDSTYAAKILTEMGYAVEGAVLKMHEYTETDAARISAEELGIPLHVVDCTEAFGAAVVENFLDEYCAARTPNPCIICNGAVKFKCLLDFAEENGFDRIATGHYARIVKLLDGGEERFAVKRAEDAGKDQTYMLWRLSQKQLSKLLFPLADLKKEDVRRLAAESGLSASERKDSQEICFIPSGDYAGYVEERRGKFPKGDFVDKNGRVIGEHKGVIHYTVGQRKGLGISLGERAFVTDIDGETGKVTLDTEPQSKKFIRIGGVVFSGMKEPSQVAERNALVKVRYQAKPASARVVFYPEGVAEIFFEEAQRSVAPGQSAVIYDGDVILAGGFIER